LSHPNQRRSMAQRDNTGRSRVQSRTPLGPGHVNVLSLLLFTGRCDLWSLQDSNPDQGDRPRQLHPSRGDPPLLKDPLAAFVCLVIRVLAINERETEYMVDIYTTEIVHQFLHRDRRALHQPVRVILISGKSLILA
jgi:hypothetical protein